MPQPPVIVQKKTAAPEEKLRRVKKSKIEKEEPETEILFEVENHPHCFMC
ncbi:MAG: hypothetical protein WDM71_10565 [Ferruginibacter sp.]